MSEGKKKKNDLHQIELLLKNSFSNTDGLINQLREEIKQPNILREINWKKLITQSKQIDFLVQGWDGWMNLHERELEVFFSNNGKFNLYLIDHSSTDEDAVTIRKLMSARLDKTDNEVILEITNTIKSLTGIFNRNKDNTETQTGEMNIFPINEVNWYFGARFVPQSNYDTDHLVLSLYSHKKFSLNETPAILLNKQSAPNVFRWFDTELAYLKSLK